MIKLISCKIYNTDTAKEIFEESVYVGGNYVGSDCLMLTAKGSLFIYISSTGQDCHRSDSILAVTTQEAVEWLDNRKISDDELVKLTKFLPIEEA